VKVRNGLEVFVGDIWLFTDSFRSQSKLCLILDLVMSDYRESSYCECLNITKNEKQRIYFDENKFFYTLVCREE